MQYRRVGNSGLKVSTICVGSWFTFGDVIDEQRTTTLVRRAVDLGVNFFDTADVYARGASEAALGRAIAGIPRKDLVLATKCFFPMGDGPNDRGLSRKHIDESIHASLKRLGTEYVDILQCHRYDLETPLEETVRAMDDLVRKGQVLYWGVSMWTAEQIETAKQMADYRNAVGPISNQPRYNLLAREIEESVQPTCERLGVGILCYSPLAQGVLSGKYSGGSVPKGTRGADKKRNVFMQDYLTEENLARVDRMCTLAGEARLKPSQLALAWCLARPAVSSVLVGVTGIGQIEENVAAAEAEVDPELMDALDDLFAPSR